MLHVPEFSERRVYRQRPWLRIFAIVFTSLGVVFSIAMWTETLTGRRESTFSDLFVPIVLVMGGMFFLYVSFTNYVALSPSMIEYRSPFGRDELPLGRVRGRRRYLDKGGYKMPREWRLKVESDDDRYPALDFQERYFKFDAAFYDWFKSLPDLDAADETSPKTSNFGLV
jgi:hypothetical protein